MTFPSDEQLEELHENYKFDPANPIRPHIRELVARGNVTQSEVHKLRVNSWEWEALVPAMDDEAFFYNYEYCKSNTHTDRSRPNMTYNDAMCNLYADEVIRRFKSWVEHKHAPEALGLAQHYGREGYDVKIMIRRKQS